MRDGVFLRFSPSRGRSDGTFHVPLRDRGDPSAATLRADPAKAAMLGTANGAGIHESVHPCTAPWHVGVRTLAVALASAAGCCETGPPEARRGCEGKVRRRAHTMCARSLNAHGRASSEPRSALAQSQGRMPGDRAAGGVFLWLPFFAQAKKVTRSPQASGSSALRAQPRASQVVMNLANPVTDLT